MYRRINACVCVCVISLLGFWFCRNTFPYVCVDGSCHNTVRKKGQGQRGTINLRQCHGFESPDWNAAGENDTI